MPLFLLSVDFNIRRVYGGGKIFLKFTVNAAVRADGLSALAPYGYPVSREEILCDTSTAIANNYIKLRSAVVRANITRRVFVSLKIIGVILSARKYGKLKADKFTLVLPGGTLKVLGADIFTRRHILLFRK